eukprot:scaffold217451_cov15-Prasinocladus_malaysianus.AAC.1
MHILLPAMCVHSQIIHNIIIYAGVHTSTASLNHSAQDPRTTEPVLKRTGYTGLSGAFVILIKPE